MPTRTIVFENGFRISDDEIKNISDKIAKLMLSELPEEIQTYDGATYILRRIGERLKSMKIAL